MRDEVSFLLDGDPVTLRDVDPTLTVLELLREELDRTGTKEGCAEGDCGACMVVVVDVHEGELRFQAINSCIQFVATLDGKALITVESLSLGGTLHPAQQAMVTCHGSQCGFCTPGFVMTLFALHQTERDVPTPTAVDDALAGNLCRCTGYRPIVDAALAMFETESDWQAPWGDAQTLKNQLLALADRKGLATGRDDRRFIAPASVDSLAETYAEHPAATLLAGGTDVGLWVTKQYRDLPTIISIGDIEELKRIEHDASGMIFGAAVTFTEAMPTLLAEYPELGSLLRRWASPPIRNAATLGGNIANGSPIGDSMPALIALGATVVLRKGGSTREIALEALYHDYMVNDLQPAEFVVAVRVPKRKPNQRVAAYKISKRFDQDISAVCAGISVLERADALHEVRVAFGGLAGTVKRAHHCEQALEGRAADAAQFEAAADALAQDFTPLTDMRASADYRLQVAGNLLRRFGLSVATPDAQLEVYDFGR